MSDVTKALEQIAAVAAWQARDDYHPLTCGNDSRHDPLVPGLVGDKSVLVCPDCDYRQACIPDVVLEAGAKLRGLSAARGGAPAPERCFRCGDGMSWSEKVKAWLCVGCATPATLRERAEHAISPEAKMRYEAAARREGEYA